MHYYKLLPLFCLLFLGCEKLEEEEELQCSAPPCSMYQDIWREMMVEKNNLNDYYLDNYVKVTSSEVIIHSKGEQFVINYIVTIDWAEITVQDAFMVKIADNPDVYPNSDHLKRGEYLSKIEVDALIKFGGYDSRLTEMKPVTSLNFSSATDALDAVRAKAKDPNMYFDHLGYKVSTAGFRANGHPYMFCMGPSDEVTKTRMDGEIDLVSKNISTYPTQLQGKSGLMVGP